MASQDRIPVIKQETQSQDKPRRRWGIQHRSQHMQHPTNNNAKFKGKTKDLEGRIYDVGVPNQVHLFENTTNEISVYASQKLK